MNPTLNGRCVLLGVTGGIAVYKACEITSRLKKLGADVRVVMTKNAARFVPPLTFESLSGNPVVDDMWERPTTWEVEHISLAQRAELFLVAPCTANFIGKYAAGIADDMLTTTAMATRAPMLLCPAMNTGMYESAATQHNLEVLKARGVRFVDPGVGRLACGDVGIGRLAEPETIVDAVLALFAEMDAGKARGDLSVSKDSDGSDISGVFDSSNIFGNPGGSEPSPQRVPQSAHDLAGLRILVTAGPTREAVDPVRYISNRASGKMGYAIAEAAAQRGAAVTLVSGPTGLEAPGDVERVCIETTMELFGALTSRFPDCDIVIQAAAPADYRPANPSAQKIKKQSGAGLTLELVENPDIAATLGASVRADQVLVVFAAETENLLENARGKLARKNADLLVANDVSMPGAGFDVDTNIVRLLDRDGGDEALPIMQKRALADVILDRAATLHRRKAGGAVRR